MSWDVQLAKLFKDRDNVPSLGNMIGTVATISPLTISLFAGEVILTEDMLMIADRLLPKQLDCLINGLESTIEFDESLAPGDKVLVMPSEDELIFFIIDKFVSL